MKKKLYVFYLVNILLIGGYLLLCGLFYAGAGSERVWHGAEEDRICFSDVIRWGEEKWDLFLRAAGDKIFR